MLWSYFFLSSGIVVCRKILASGKLLHPPKEELLTKKMYRSILNMDTNEEKVSTPVVAFGASSRPDLVFFVFSLSPDLDPAD